jgi:SAM-dependent methyltransferase
MTIEATRDLATRLIVSTGALAAFGLALEERATGLQLDPAIKAEVDHTLGALGARDVLDGVDHRVLRPLLAEIRTTMLLSAKLLMKPTSGPGWSHTEDEILQNTGDISAAFPVQWKTAIVPRLEGLAERLESADGTFLDVGVGVGALSIAMTTLWPSLRVVGIDRWRPSLAIARERVQRLGLGTRIELREQAVEDLADSQVFDLVWLPSLFISETVVGPALARLCRTLRPGGWLLFPCVNPAGGPLTIAYARLRTVFWGGRPWTPAEAQALLNQAGYAQVQTLPSPPAVLGAMSVGRRP